MTTSTDTKSTKRRQILLVDDDVAFTSMLKDCFLSQGTGGWIVHTAENYLAALACLKVNSVDLVVLDIQMPIMDGLQFLTLLKRTRPGLPVVILTSMATENNRTFALQNGAALFLDKTSVSDGIENIYSALETVAATPTQGFRGVLRQVGLTDVLQMECLGCKSSILEITTQDGSGGRIYISDGAIVHAEAGPGQGERALFDLLALPGGEFHLKPFAKPPRHTIDGHWESLIMEAARLHDEAASGLATERAEAAALEPLSTEAAFTENRRIEEIVLFSNVGEVLYEWQAAGIERRLRLLDQLATKSAQASKLLPLGQASRIEIEAEDSRVVVLLQPDRKVLVRSVAMAPNQEPP